MKFNLCLPYDYKSVSDVKKKQPTCVPEVEFVCGAGAEVLCVVEADKALRAIGASQGRQEAGSLTLITLPLIVRQQLKCLPLCLRYTL